VEIVPLTEQRWPDFVELFLRSGPRGGGGPGTSGCWCMWWRERRIAEENRAAIEALARNGAEPGLLAYNDARAVGWVSVAPRESFPQPMRSRSYRPQDADVWCVTCLYVHAADRHHGVADSLVERAVAHAFERGASAVEAFPATVPARSDYMGSLAAYRRLGFVPVREASTRTVVRLTRD
jgi:GNAT superfamily N-acetyltransferase